MVWNENYPNGRVDDSTRDMINMDQAGVKIEATHPKYAKGFFWERSHFDGSYNRDKN